MSVHFKPDMKPYKNLGSFRMWCQKVLPAVYDESLSYYEVLCKLKDYLNSVIENVDGLYEDMDALYNAYELLEDYVNEYFDNLDVQAEINNKLDDMARDGSLSALIAPFVEALLPDEVASRISAVVESQLPAVVRIQLPPELANQLPAEVAQQIPDLVTAWLNLHIVQPVEVIIDDSLTISGAAADAKTVGDAIRELKSALTSLESAPSLYDESGNTDYTGHAGDTNRYYVLNVPIKNKKFCSLTLYIYADCTFKIFLVGKTSGKVKYVNDYVFKAGLNTVIFANNYNEDVYIAIDGASNKMVISASGTMKYSQQSLETVAIDDSITINFSKTAGFRLTIKTIDTIAKLTESAELTDALNDEIQYIEGIISESTLYNQVENTSYTSHAGGTNKYYVLGTEIEKNLTVHIKYYAYDDCTFNVIVIGKDTSIVKYVNSYVAKQGINEFSFTNTYGEVCYVALDAEANKLVYSAGGTMSYDDITLADATVGDSVTYNLSKTAGFRVTIKTAYNLDSVGNTVLELVNSQTPNLYEKIIFLAGDSRSSTDYDFYQSTLVNKTGATVIVGGASGKDAAYNASSTYMQMLIDNPHDFSIWLVGGNDNGASGSVGTFSADTPLYDEGESVVSEISIEGDYVGTKFIQAIDYIMRKYKSLFYDFKTLDNGHKPKMIFCSDLPQKRNNAENAYSIPANWERKRLAIIECCEKNNVAFLDLYKLCNFDMSYEPYWTSPTDKVHDNGLYFMDGLHPNRYGIDIITSLEVPEILKYISINPYPLS